MPVRLRSALAVVIGTVAVSLAGAPVAGAATLSTAYAGSAAGDGLRLALDLPQAVGPLPASSVTGFISAHGTLVRDGIRSAHPQIATATAALAAGDLVSAAGPLAALDRSVTATRAHPTATDTLGALPSNPLAAGALGPLTATVHGLDATGAQAALVDGHIARFGDLLPAQLRDQLDAALAQGSTALQQAIQAALSALAPVLGPIVGQDPTGTAAKLQQELQRLSTQLPQLLDQVEAASVVTVHGLRASQAITHGGAGAAVTSRAATTLADLDVLGGLVRLTGFASSAVASATGARGGAAAHATSTVASVQIGDGLLGVALTDSGRLTADVAGLLPPSVVAQVNAALAQVTGAVNQVLSQAGVSVTPAATSHHVAPDGRSADASASGLLVTLQPPGQPKPLLQLGIGAARASAQVQVARVLDERAELPHTGSGLGTTALVGASGALLGGLALRRRLGRAG